MVSTLHLSSLLLTYSNNIRYWLPMLGHRSLVYDEATKIAGKNGNFQRIDLFNAINAGIFPEWEFAVQILPDDGTYMYRGIDLLDPTKVIPEEWAYVSPKAYL